MSLERHTDMKRDRENAPRLTVPESTENAFAETRSVSVGATGGMSIPEAEQLVKPMAEFCASLASKPVEVEDAKEH